jgi:DNA-directed RNA polymerase beta' subunit
VGGCGAPIPTNISLKSHRIVIQEKLAPTLIDENNGKETKGKKKDIFLTGQTVYNILKNIRPEHCKILGFIRSKPVDLLISTLAVAPPQIRPSI